MTRRQGGFTIVEVLIAIVMLSVGVLALAGSAGGITRMLSNGQRKTRSYAMGSSLIDSLRRVANNSCAGLPASGSGTRGEMSIAWTVSNAGITSRTHAIEVRMSYRVGPYAKGDTLLATLYC